MNGVILKSQKRPAELAISNQQKIWNKLPHECCFVCSNSVLKSVFFRLEQPMHMHSSNALKTRLLQPQVSMGTGASNGWCSDAMNLPINDSLFHLDGRTIPPYCALNFLPFISIGVSRLCISIVFDWSMKDVGWIKATVISPCSPRPVAHWS